jgi:hypothetical protein
MDLCEINGKPILALDIWEVYIFPKPFYCLINVQVIV